jgi:hypothetical protein
VLWIVYLLIDNDAIGWVAFIVLVPVAVLGFTMLARWIPGYRNSRATAGVGDQRAANTPGESPPERSFPILVVAAHGVLAVATVILVLLTDLHIGGTS